LIGENIYSQNCKELLSESSAMPLFLQFLQHSPENCPLNNEKVRKIGLTFMSKHDQLLKKHGIKTVGAWHSAEDHVYVIVSDVPNIEAWQKFMMEPEVLNFMAYHTGHTRLVTTMDETAKMYPK
jgi:hypothetical protein